MDHRWVDMDRWIMDGYGWWIIDGWWIIGGWIWMDGS